MASTASSTFSCLLLSKKQRHLKPRRMHVRASDDPSGDATGTKRKPVIDTRIHWSNEDEGWIGGRSKPETEYQFLGVSADADVEEIKAAYRKLSKEYHPDTTSLPLKTASEKFMQLREAYNVLSNENSRQFYDWTLAQEAESMRAQRMRMRIEDPYEQDLRNWESIPDTVDRLGGKNMKLSDQAMTALTIDVVIIVFSIISVIVYVLFFQDSY
ncbi:NAD(P)H-quinone oxidoreductase subunit T, chloroplastic [Asparagus officinalis]|uniref:NAD(P)H-quinone oxidoreductase subunit T, chloroplastic n=1 Tax=Asparagus officinalis TaxID=4686 RepID=UPI00098E51C7|nr:NAD(P)H-quinone oxidoreductase subunit T, chloroplastic [Asparagus officinalis]